MTLSPLFLCLDKSLLFSFIFKKYYSQINLFIFLVFRLFFQEATCPFPLFLLPPGVHISLVLSVLVCCKIETGLLGGYHNTVVLATAPPSLFPWEKSRYDVIFQGTELCWLGRSAFAGRETALSQFNEAILSVSLIWSIAASLLHSGHLIKVFQHAQHCQVFPWSNKSWDFLFHHRTGVTLPNMHFGFLPYSLSTWLFDL